MPTTPDRFPGDREDDALILEDVGEDVAPGSVGFKNNADVLRARDRMGPYDIRGLHCGDSYTEVTEGVGGRIEAVTVWTSPAKTQKVAETVTTYVGGLPTQVVTTHYDDTGTARHQLTEVPTYQTGTIRIQSIVSTEVLLP